MLTILAESVPFKPFTSQHLAAVIVGAVAVAAFILAGRRGGDTRKRTSALLAWINLTAFPLGWWAWRGHETRSLDNLLPLHLCDIAAFIAGFALLTKRPLLCALTYFWGLAATFQALLTPAITVGFPHPPFIMFFVQHFAIVGAALYLPLAEGWRPRQPFWKGPLEVYVCSVVYLLFAMGVNAVLKTNFAFASRPPDNPSLIDHLGPWPWYLVSMLCIGGVLFLLLALPFARRTGPGK